MFNFYKKPKVTQVNIAGENRYFDRTYYLNNSNPTWSDRTYDSFAIEGYMKNVIANRAINLISKSASSARLTFFKVNSDGSYSNINDNDQIINLIMKPNPMMNYNIFIENLIKNYLISGNAYVQLVRDKKKKPKELYLLRPDRMTVIPGYETIPSGYKYKIDGMIFDFPCDEETGISEILHAKAFHPYDDWYGLSSMEAAQFSIDQHNECVKWNKALLENGARPSGALVIKNQLSDENYNKLKMQIDDKLKGGDNAGKIMILEGGLEWKEISMNPKDMDFIETKNASARDIAIAFGVPSQLLGIKGDNTYGNLVEARIALWEETIIPLLADMVSKLAQWLSYYFSEKIVINVDLDSIPVISDKRRNAWESLNKLTFLTENEKREMIDFVALKKVYK